MQRRLRASLAIAVIAIAACSDDDDATSTTPAGPAVVTSAPSAATESTPASSASSPATTAGPATTAAATDAPTTVATTAPPTTSPAAQALGDPRVTFTQIGDAADGLVDLAPATDGRLYWVLQDGIVRLTDADGGNASVALDITDLTSFNGEQGLLGLAVHPDQPLAYLNYTNNAGDTVIAEYAIAADGTFGAGSARAVLTFDQPYANHNGGGMVFGPDGYLYISTGDGGAAADPERRALDPVTDSPPSLLGKLLRIDPAASRGQQYTVPDDNPFVGDDSVQPEVWSYGLRNPWRFTFDEATGDLWIADVGQNAFEEIDVAPADESGLNAGRGLSFGWSAFEGDERFNDDQPADGHEPPVHTYGRDDGCSVSGAAAYRGDGVPGLTGGFVFADYCNGTVWALAMDGSGKLVELGNVASPTDLSIVADDLYVMSHNQGLFRVDPA